MCSTSEIFLISSFFNAWPPDFHSTRRRTLRPHESTVLLFTGPVALEPPPAPSRREPAFFFPLRMCGDEAGSFSFLAHHFFVPSTFFDSIGCWSRLDQLLFVLRPYFRSSLFYKSLPAKVKCTAHQLRTFPRKVSKPPRLVWFLNLSLPAPRGTSLIRLAFMS